MISMDIGHLANLEEYYVAGSFKGPHPSKCLDKRLTAGKKSLDKIISFIMILVKTTLLNNKMDKLPMLLF